MSDRDSSDIARIARLLGVPESGLELVRTFVLPDASVGLASGPREPLLELVERSPHFARIELPPPLVAHADPPERDPIDIVRWETSPSVVVIEPRAGVELESDRGDVMPWRDGALVAHAGRGAFVLRITRAQDTFVLVGEPPSEARRGATLWLIRLSAITTRGHLAHLFDGWVAPEWMLQIVRRTGPIERVVALGVVGRLWIPSLPRDKAALLAGAELATTRARLAADRLDESELQPIVELVEARAFALVQSLDEALAGATSEQGLADLARALVRSRDDIASVAWCIGGRPPFASRVSAALATMDDAALVHGSLFALVDDWVDDERLSAVAWQEPSAWWGALAVSDAELDP